MYNNSNIQKIKVQNSPQKATYSEKILAMTIFTADEQLEQKRSIQMKNSICNKFYIGQTGTSLAERYNKHIKDINQQYIKSNFAEHIHRMDINTQIYKLIYNYYTKHKKDQN